MSRTYTIKELADLAKISVRSLHHYDQIGLLKPKQRTPSGYRLYDHADLLRLQQVLFYRQLSVLLKNIKRLLDDPAFDPIAALREHRAQLLAERERLDELLRTIEKTIQSQTEDHMPLSDKELYEGFSKEKIERYKSEVSQAYDPKIVAESERRLKNVSSEQWQAHKKESEQVTLQLSQVMHKDPADPEVQELIARHKETIEFFYHVTPEIYAGLARLYVDHPEFRAFYEKVAPGLAEFLSKAMTYYAETSMQA